MNKLQIIFSILLYLAGSNFSVVLGQSIFFTSRDGKVFHYSMCKGTTETLINGTDFIAGIDFNEKTNELFLANFTSNKIEKYNIETGVRSNVVLNAGGGVKDIAIDTSKGIIYWSAEKDMRIYSANINGSNKQTVVTNASSANQIFYYARNNELYWSDDNSATHSVQKFNLTTKAQSTLFSNGFRDCRGITIDEKNNKLIFTDSELDGIYESTLGSSSYSQIFSNRSLPVFIHAIGDLRFFIDNFRIYVSTINQSSSFYVINNVSSQNLYGIDAACECLHIDTMTYRDTTFTVVTDTIFHQDTLEETIYDTITVYKLDTTQVFLIDTFYRIFNDTTEVTVYDTIYNYVDIAVQDTLYINLYEEGCGNLTYKLYPNPTSEYVYFFSKKPDCFPEARVDLVSELGQVLQSVPYTALVSFDMRGLARATYLIRLVHANGVTIVAKKVVVR